jgi:hypothetical protein
VTSSLVVTAMPVIVPYLLLPSGGGR